MPSKSSAAGGNKNTVMGIVLGVLVLAIAIILYMNFGGDEEPSAPAAAQVSAPEETPEAKAKGRAPEQAAPEEAAEEAPKTKVEEGGDQPRNRRPTEKAPEKLNTSPPA